MTDAGSKAPTFGFWSCVAAAVLALYVAAYGIVRWQDVLIDDVKMWTEDDGVSYSQRGVRSSPYVDERTKWAVLMGRPAEVVFYPLCQAEDACRRVARKD